MGFEPTNRSSSKQDPRTHRYKKKELSYEYSKLFGGMGGTNLEEIQAVEVMKYMRRSYEDYLNTPLEILQAVLVRMEMEAKKQ